MKEKKRVGICTLFTGYNYGSSLQAFALKNHVEKLGYKCDILKLSGSLIKGRDFRLKKAFITLFRMMLHSKNKKKVLKSFSQNNKGQMNENTIKRFDDFFYEYITPVYYNYNELKSIAKDNSYSYFICGSDQIWNSTAFYVDPFYYLQFSPREKRVAYAPSFGREYIPSYNKKKIKKYLLGFDNISVREESGSIVIKNLIEKSVPACLDPSFLLDKKEWIQKFNLTKSNKKYIFAYFLNEPTNKAKNFLQNLSKVNNIDIIYIGSGFEAPVAGGPIEFLNYIYGATFVVTDSFHGVAFSINFNKQFFVFDRNYTTENQSTRITSLLKKMELEERFEPRKKIIDKKIVYAKVNKLLNKEIEKSKKYLEKVLVSKDENE